jgi:hypothetical protein
LRFLRRWLPLLLGTAALALVWGRFAIEARRAVADAQAAVAAGDRAEAARSYLDALRVYVPGSPYQRRALDGLDRLGAEARQAGDAVGERQALEATRAGLLGTRGIVIPYRARLGAAEARLQELDAAAGVAPPVALLVPRGRGPGRVGIARGSAMLSTLIALVGLATWIAAVALLVRTGMEDRRRSPEGDGTTTAGAAATGAGERAGAGSPPGEPPASGLRLLVPALFLIGLALFLAGLRFA